MADGGCFAQAKAKSEHWSRVPEAPVQRSRRKAATAPPVVQRQDVPLPGERWNDPAVQRAKERLAQAKCSECGKKKKVQRQDNGAAVESPSVGQIAASGFQGPAQKLPHLARVEQSFGMSMGHVQAYVGGAAARACEALGAQAYASGNQVAFRQAPSPELVGHEAAHTVQQASGKVQLSGKMGRPGDRYEREADAVGEKVARGQSSMDLLGGYTQFLLIKQNHLPKQASISTTQSTQLKDEVISNEKLVPSTPRNEQADSNIVVETEVPKSSTQVIESTANNTTESSSREQKSRAPQDCTPQSPELCRLPDGRGDCQCVYDSYLSMTRCATDRAYQSAVYNLRHFLSNAGGIINVFSKNYIKNHLVVNSGIEGVLTTCGQDLGTYVIPRHLRSLRIDGPAIEVELPPPENSPGRHGFVTSSENYGPDYFFAYGISSIWGKFTYGSASQLTVRRQGANSIRATGSMYVTWDDSYDWHSNLTVRIGSFSVPDYWAKYLVNHCKMAKTFDFRSFGWTVPVEIRFDGLGTYVSSSLL